MCKRPNSSGGPLVKPAERYPACRASRRLVPRVFIFAACAGIVPALGGCYTHVVEARGHNASKTPTHTPAEDDLFLFKDIEEATKPQRDRR